MIASAVQKGNYVYVYDERGSQKCSIFCQDGSLQGYTGTTVSIRKGNYVYVYDETGSQKSSVFVG
jgi:hypothetical protein